MRDCRSGYPSKEICIGSVLSREHTDLYCVGMNYHLFSAFLIITFVLVIVPGPIVTLIIATGATRGTRAALLTVAGSTLGNAALLGLHRIRLELDLKNLFGSIRNHALDRRGVSVLAGHSVMAPCWRKRRGAVAAGPRVPFTRLRRGHNQSENDCVLHGVSTAICRSQFAGWISARSDVHRVSDDGDGHGRRLGDRRRRRPQPVFQTDARTLARSTVRRGADWRWCLVVVRATSRVIGNADLKILELTR